MPSIWRDATSCKCHVALSVLLPAMGSALVAPAFFFLIFANLKAISHCCFNPHFSDTVKVAPLFLYDYCASLVAQMVKNLPAMQTDLGSIPGSGRFPGGGNGTHFSILAWRIPWTEEPG